LVADAKEEELTEDGIEKTEGVRGGVNGKIMPVAEKQVRLESMEL